MSETIQSIICYNKYSKNKWVKDMYAIMIVEDEELIRQGLTSLVDYEQFGMTVINQVMMTLSLRGKPSS